MSDSVESRHSAGWKLQWPAWLLAGVGRLGVVRGRSRRNMELLETLHLGGRRQLLLVRCEGQSYLVGAGSDSVHSIVRIAALNRVDALIEPEAVFEQLTSTARPGR